MSDFKIGNLFSVSGNSICKGNGIHSMKKERYPKIMLHTNWHLKTIFILVLLIQQFSSENFIQIQRSSTWKYSRHWDFTTPWQILIWQMGKLIKEQARHWTSFWTGWCTVLSQQWFYQKDWTRRSLKSPFNLVFHELNFEQHIRGFFCNVI